ncbi:hypothetical protein BEWA_019400 [Theileria equi strain WA]|uniref:Uncharacterized protein n=1 Tax=Theileria equi strain WA TaxID=1537102 RepID=L0AU62_THEEQ|nr:hypothetical protein BEWA_019400 [Theileria equi strain WA]AFZ79095.1 hypothetical protein BEWA_019400 [Theileria equi strain WA]|eukprot:XP_004828761.1 hypothetical protein BEWA_019400 [Theileria equi strain WA]
MDFNLALLIVIGVNLHNQVFNYVCTLHISQSSDNYKYFDVLSLKDTNFQVLRNSSLNLTKDSNIQSTQDVLNTAFRNISQLYNRIKCRKSSKYLFIQNQIISKGQNTHDNKNAHIQCINNSNCGWFDDFSVNLEKFEEDETDEDEEFLSLLMKGDELSQTGLTYEEVCNELGLDPGIKLSWNGLVRISRKLLNKPAPPDNFFMSLLHETGVLSTLRRIFGYRKDKINHYTDKNLEDGKNVMNDPQKEASKISTTTKDGTFTIYSPYSGQEITYKDEDYVFGISPVMLKGEEAIPISETALRGFLGLAYFKHLQRMSKDNPNRLQKISTVLHKIYKRPILVSDMKPNDYITDSEVLSDVENIIMTQSKTYSEFIKNYPNLKWPITDEDLLNLFSIWFNDHEECNSLVNLMREAYGPGINIRFPNMIVRFLVNPVISVLSGLSFGKILDSILKYLTVKHPFYKISRIVNKRDSKTVCTLIAGFLTYVGLSYNSGVKSDIFNYTLKSVLDGSEELDKVSTSEYINKIIEKTGELKDILNKGHVPIRLVSEELENFVLLAFLKAFRRIIKLVDVYENFSDGNSGELNSRQEHSITVWNRLCKQVSYVASICLPIAGVSVYRILYQAACELADSDDLPQTIEGEVLGGIISNEYGEAFAELYREGDEEAKVPPLNIERSKRVALLFSIFSTQVFSSMVNFQDVTAPFANIDTDHIEEIEGVKLGSSDIEELRKIPKLRSTLDDVEEFFTKLHKRSGGYLERVSVEPEYGIFLKDELLGETKEEKIMRENFLTQKRRDSITDILNVPGKTMEILKSLSMILGVNELWLLDQFKEAMIDECAYLMYSEHSYNSVDLNQQISDFNISPMHIDTVKRRILYKTVEKMSRNLKSKFLDSGENIETKQTIDKISKSEASTADTNETINLYTKEGLDEYLKKSYNHLLRVSRNFDIGKEVVLECFRVLTFPLLLKELFSLDLTTVTNDRIMEIKLKYESDDLTFVNALSEVIKKFSSLHKQELVSARGLNNWYQIEKHMSSLLTAKVKVCSAVCDIIDKSMWYRIERAFRFNHEYVEKEFTHEEIIGKSYALERVNGDWELIDPPEPLSLVEEAKKRWEEDTKIEPLPVYGVDKESSFMEKEELKKLIEEGKISKDFEYIPTEFYVGDPPQDQEVEQKPEYSKKNKGSLISSKDAYACWVSYCYRKRKVDPNDVKSLLTIFPFLERLVGKTNRDWRRLYLRERIKEGYFTDANLMEELNCTPNEALDVCSVAYEEELLKSTHAFVSPIEDDIGDVGDTHFNPFHLSIYNRLSYLYSERLPDNVEMEHLRKIQKFLSLPESAVESIHTKCLWFAFDKFVALTITENIKKPWKYVLNTYIIPRAKELSISEDAYSRIITKGKHDFLKLNALRMLENCEISSFYADKCHEVIKMFTNYEILSYENSIPRLKFTIRGNTDGHTNEIIETYILSSIHTNNKVDMVKLKTFCAIFGLVGEKRDAILKKLGKKMYNKFLNDHFGLKVNMSSLNELKHLHEVYALNQRDLEELIQSYREMKVFEGYEPFSGIEGMKRICDITEFHEPISKYDTLNRDRRIQWLINILRDLVSTTKDSQSPKYTINQFFSLSQQMLEFFNDKKMQKTNSKKKISSKGIENTEEPNNYDFQSVFGILQTAVNKLELTEEEFLEGCFVFSDENINKFLDETLEKLVNLDKDGATESLLKFIKTASITPPSKLNWIKSRLTEIEEPEKLRSLLINAADSDVIVGRGCKILDLLLYK